MSITPIELIGGYQIRLKNKSQKQGKKCGKDETFYQPPTEKWIELWCLEDNNEEGEREEENSNNCLDKNNIQIDRNPPFLRLVGGCHAGII